MRDLGQRGGRGLHPVGVFLIHGAGHIAVGDAHRLAQGLEFRHQRRDGRDAFFPKQQGGERVAFLRAHTLEGFQHAHDRAHSVGLQLLLQLVGVDLQIFVDGLLVIRQRGGTGSQYIHKIFHGRAGHVDFGPGGLESRGQSGDVLGGEAGGLHQRPHAGENLVDIPGLGVHLVAQGIDDVSRMARLLRREAHGRLPCGQRLARLFGADAPGDGHFRGLLGHAQHLLAGLAQPGLGRRRHDGHDVLKALSGATGHGLRIGKQLLHDLFRRIHDLAQVGEHVFRADGQLDRDGRRSPHSCRAQQPALQILPLSLQGAGIGHVGLEGGTRRPRLLHAPHEPRVISLQGLYTTADLSCLQGKSLHFLLIERQLCRQVEHPAFRRLDAGGEAGGGSPRTLCLGSQTGQFGFRLLQLSGQTGEPGTLLFQSRAQLSHGRVAHLADSLRDHARLAGGILERCAVAPGEGRAQLEGNGNFFGHDTLYPPLAAFSTAAASR